MVTAFQVIQFAAPACSNRRDVDPMRTGMMRRETGKPALQVVVAAVSALKPLFS
jgi:hypothetical protein